MCEPPYRIKCIQPRVVRGANTHTFSNRGVHTFVSELYVVSGCVCVCVCCVHFCVSVIDVGNGRGKSSHIIYASRAAWVLCVAGCMSPCICVQCDDGHICEMCARKCCSLIAIVQSTANRIEEVGWEWENERIQSHMEDFFPDRPRAVRSCE